MRVTYFRNIPVRSHIYIYYIHSVWSHSFSGLLGNMQHYAAGSPVGGWVDRLFSYRGLQ